MHVRMTHLVEDSLPGFVISCTPPILPGHPSTQPEDQGVDQPQLFSFRLI